MLELETRNFRHRWDTGCTWMELQRLPSFRGLFRLLLVPELHKDHTATAIWKCQLPGLMSESPWCAMCVCFGEQVGKRGAGGGRLLCSRFDHSGIL